MSSVAKKSIQPKDAMRRIAPLLFAFTGALSFASSPLVAAATLTVSVTDQDSAPLGDAVVYATPLVATVAHKAPVPADLPSVVHHAVRSEHHRTCSRRGGMVSPGGSDGGCASVGDAAATAGPLHCSHVQAAAAHPDDDRLRQDVGRCLNYTNM